MEKFNTRRSGLYAEYYSEAWLYMSGEIFVEVLVIASILFCVGCVLESQMRDEKSFCNLVFGLDHNWCVQSLLANNMNLNLSSHFMRTTRTGRDTK